MLFNLPSVTFPSTSPECHKIQVWLLVRPSGWFLHTSLRAEFGCYEQTKDTIVIKNKETQDQINTNKLYLPPLASLELARGSQQDLGPSFVWYHSYWCSFSAQSLCPPKRCLSSRDRRTGGRWGHAEGPCSVKRAHDSRCGQVSVLHCLCLPIIFKTH